MFEKYWNCDGIFTCRLRYNKSFCERKKKNVLDTKKCPRHNREDLKVQTEPNLDDSLTTSIIQLSQYISRDVINACVDEEINKRNKEKTRSNNALQTNQQLQQEKLLSKLAEDEKRNREKEYSKSLKLKSTKSIEKRLKLIQNWAST